MTKGNHAALLFLGCIATLLVFSLASAPTQQFALTVNDPTLAQGQAGYYTVTVNSVNGYSGNVLVAAENIPQGVSISFNPQSVSISPGSPADSSMTVSVSSTAPTGTYSIVVVGTGNGGQIVQSTTFTLAIVGGGGVSFTESGLPSGTLWSATLAGYGTESSTTDFIAFSNVTVGNSYSWSVSSPVSTDSIQYSAAPQSGLISVSSSSSSASQSVAYSQSTYSVTFANDPLPSTAQWSITFDGQTESAYASNSITFANVPAGSYSWSTATTIPGSAGIQYIASPTSGTINVPSTTFVTIAYSTQYYLSVITPVGSASGAGWYNAGSVADFGVTPSTVTSGNTQYQFYEFSGAGSTNDQITTPEGSVTMNAPVTQTASWTVWQYEQHSSTTPGYYTYSDYYTYSCPSGAQLVGTECETTNTWYTCPSGYTLEGSTCTEQVTTPGYWEDELVSDTVWNPGYYSCPSGWSLSGSSCSMTTPGYWTQVTTSYTTTTWVDTGSYEVWVSTGSYQVWVDTGSYEVWVDTGGYWTYQTVQDYFCFWSWNAMTQDPQQVCIPWGTTTIATWVETGYWQTVDTGYWQTVDTGYWQTVDTGYWLTTTTYVTTNVWNPGQTLTEGATWNPGYWSTTYSYELVWIDPVTTTYTADPTLNTSVSYSAATATLNTAETWHPPVTNYYWAWTNTGAVV